MSRLAVVTVTCLLITHLSVARDSLINDMGKDWVVPIQHPRPASAFIPFLFFGPNSQLLGFAGAMTVARLAEVNLVMPCFSDWALYGEQKAANVSDVLDVAALESCGVHFVTSTVDEHQGAR